MGTERPVEDETFGTALVWSVDKNLGIVNVRPAESYYRMDSVKSMELGEDLDTISNLGLRFVVIDMSKVEYVSSAALRELVHAHKVLRNMYPIQEDNQVLAGITIKNASQRSREVFDLSGTNHIFTMLDVS